MLPASPRGVPFRLFHVQETWFNVLPTALLGVPFRLFHVQDTWFNVLPTAPLGVPFCRFMYRKPDSTCYQLRYWASPSAFFMYRKPVRLSCMHIHSKHGMLKQCCDNVGPMPTTLAQHKTATCGVLTVIHATKQWWLNVVAALAQRRRRWANVATTLQLDEYLMCSLVTLHDYLPRPLVSWIIHVFCKGACKGKQQ